MVKKFVTDMSLTGNGFRDWLIQRFTSIIIAAYFFFIIGYFSLNTTIYYASLRGLYSQSWMQIFTVITLLCLFLHTWIGIWTVITDYIKPPMLRLAAQGLVALMLLIYFIWGIDIFWRLA